jgi:trigger factor
MKVDVQDLSTVKKVLNVEIPASEVTKELDKSYKTLKKNVKIKGFRQGKVPLSLLERRFGKDVHAEVSGQLIQNSYVEALREAGLVPLAEPLVDPPELEKDQPYVYSATIEVQPPIGELNVKGLQLTRRIQKVDDDEIDAQLKMLQKSQAQLKSIEKDRPVELGDYVLIDYEGFKDGKAFAPAGKTENFMVEVGSGRILEDFDKQLVGMYPNETKEFPLHFPADYFNKELADQDVTFTVTVKEIKEEVLPDIDDEFAKDLGEYQTLAELREAIGKQLERKYQTQSERALRADIVNTLIGQQDFELPEVLVKNELSALVQEARDALSNRGMSLEDTGQTEESLSKRYYPVAEKRVREYLLLQKVIDQEELALTDDMLEQSYNEVAEAINQTVDTIKQFHGVHKEAFEVFRQKTLEKAAVKFITDNATVETMDVKTADEQEPETDATESESETKTHKDAQGGE